MGFGRTGLCLALSCGLLAGCINANEVALKLGAPPEGAVALRTLETRRFPTTDERTILLAATQSLQDLGFTVVESAPAAGALVGAKQRDARESGQIAGGILLGVLFGAGAAMWDEEQTINVTLVSTPIINSKQVEVRVAFDRVIRNNKGMLRGESLLDPNLYQEFFNKLSAATFLEAQKI